MKFLTKNAIVIVFISLLFISTFCVEPILPEGEDAEFTHFEFVNMVGDTKIDRNKRTIVSQISDIADVENLIPTFVLTHGATAYIEDVVQKSGVSENDFSQIVNYKIVSGNRKNITYWEVAIVTVPDLKQQQDDYEFTRGAILPEGIYNFKGDVRVADSVCVIIEAGAKIILAENAKITIGKDAWFIVNGTYGKPIEFTSDTENWCGFVFNNVKEVEFSFCNFANAGQPSSNFMQINGSNIGILNCNFNNITYTGFVLDANSTFRVFDNNNLNNVASEDGHPIVFNSINSASNLGENNTITNTDTTKGILIKDGTIINSITLIGQNCPYIIETDVTCNINDVTLFIRNGVKIIMNNNNKIIVGNNDKKMLFKAEGTASSRVVFQGKDNSAGIWEGISIGSSILAGSNLTNCDILYAGNGDNSGAIRCHGTNINILTIQNCSIKHANSHAIYFTKGSFAKLIDNDFDDIAYDTTHIEP